MLRIDDLQFEGLKIYQDPKGYCFSSDSVLLANFAKFAPNSKVAEFCAGTGVVSILLTKKQKPSCVHAFEIQKKPAEIFEKSVELNHLEGKVFVHNARLEEASKILGAGSMDAIVCNPPYLLYDGKIEQPTEKQLSTTEIETSIEKVARSSSETLKFGGKLFLVHRVDRMVDVLQALRNNHLEPKRMCVVYPDAGYEPVVFLVEALSGGKPGLRMLPAVFASEVNKSFQCFK